MYTDSYHLHVSTLEVALETSGSGWLRLEFGIATAIAVVVDIVDGNLLFGIHDCSRRDCGVNEEKGWEGRSREGM